MLSTKGIENPFILGDWNQIPSSAVFTIVHINIQIILFMVFLHMFLLGFDFINFGNFLEFSF